MLEKPDIPEERIAACLYKEYGLAVAEITFLPLGADRNSAAYRVVAGDEVPYFLKLRRGSFSEIAVTLPRFLNNQGIAQVLAPLASRTGQLWVSLDPFRAILYPFVDGRNGYEVDLPDQTWRDLGTALKRIHTADLPPALRRRIRRESYSPQWREIVKTFLDHAADDIGEDVVAARLAAFLKAERSRLLDLLRRADRLAQMLQSRPREFILCHSDIHAGNVLVGANGDLHLVDWDDPILAPKECDLIFIGGGHMGAWRSPPDEEALFYEGYGQTKIDPVALAYYRYERIIQDVAAFSEQIFLTDEGGKDREQSLHYLKSTFRPGGALEIAYGSDRTLMED